MPKNKVANIKQGKIVSWIIFTVVIIAAFGALIFIQNRRPPQAPPVSPAPTIIEKKLPSKSFAKKELSPEEKIEIDEKSFHKALLTGEGCDSIEFDAALKRQCLDAMNYDEALAKNDLKLCESIADAKLKTQCLNQIYLQLAVARLDLGLCEKITDEKIRQGCSDRIQAVFGRTAKSAEDCKTIQNEALRQECLDNFYFSDSVESLKEENCASIKDDELKDRCVKTVKKNIEVREISLKNTERTYVTAEKTLDSCGQLSAENTQKCRDDANFNRASAEKNVSYCNEISDEALKTKCAQNLTVNLNDSYLRQAVYKKDPSFCDKISEEELRTACKTFAQ